MSNIIGYTITSAIDECGFNITHMPVGMLIGSRASRFGATNDRTEIGAVARITHEPIFIETLGHRDVYHFFAIVVARDPKYMDDEQLVGTIQEYTFNSYHTPVYGDSFWTIVKQDDDYVEPAPIITAETYHNARRTGQRIVVAAAIRWGDNVVVGNRHHSETMNTLIRANLSLMNRKPDTPLREQGFIDQMGVFMDRYEACKVATDAGQLYGMVKTGSKDKLYSEDIYL
jgi:hypothetical protein